MIKKFTFIIFFILKFFTIQLFIIANFVQDCPFIGMDDCVGFSVFNPPLMSSFVDFNDHTTHANDVKFVISNLSNELCSICWSTLETELKTTSSIRNIDLSDTLGNLEQVPIINSEVHLSADYSNGVMSLCSTTTNYGNQIPLRSILKQRTFSGLFWIF